MKKFKERCGAALLEVMISIAMLGLLMVPISSGILMSFRINQRSDEIMQARLAVSSAVETIMAKGIDNAEDIEALELPEVIIDTANVQCTSGCWQIPVISENFGDIAVTVYVRDTEMRNDIGGGA